MGFCRSVSWPRRRSEERTPACPPPPSASWPRLRTQWTGIHTDEVFFRDAAHGFLVWSVAALVGTIIVASAITATVSKAADVGATAATGA
jgi:hypothetical protein